MSIIDPTNNGIALAEPPTDNIDPKVLHMNDFVDAEGIIDGDSLAVPDSVRVEQQRRDASLNTQLTYAVAILDELEKRWASLHDRLLPVLGEYEVGTVNNFQMDALPKGAAPAVEQAWHICRRLAELYKGVRGADGKVQL